MIENLLSRNKKYFDNLLRLTLPNLIINLDRQNPPIVFGAGLVGLAVIKGLAQKAGIHVKYVIDNNKSLWGKRLEKALIISPSEAKREFVNEPIFVASVIYETEIVKSLNKSGFTKIYPMSYLNYSDPVMFDYRDYHEKYLALFAKGAKTKINIIHDLLADKKSKSIFKSIIKFRLKHYYGVKMDEIMSINDQYFESNVVKLGRSEIFVDCGAYDGDILRKIAKNPAWKSWKIFAFEPDTDNFKKLNKFVLNYRKENTTTIQSGLWETPGKLKFFGLGSPESYIDVAEGFTSWSKSKNETNDDVDIKELQVVSLDEYFSEKEKPTYIKMDIEGSEKEALTGAKKLIERYKPKLAICIYHKTNDLWEIPLLIKKLNPHYKLYLRHYSRELCETVVYAV